VGAGVARTAAPELVVGAQVEGKVVQEQAEQGKVWRGREGKERGGTTD
jgi:hypothetical protein